MSHYNHHQAPPTSCLPPPAGAYQGHLPPSYPPPPGVQQGYSTRTQGDPYVVAPPVNYPMKSYEPPAGYPQEAAPYQQQQQLPKSHHQQRGGGFWAGCCSAMFCCCLCDLCCLPCAVV